MGESSLVEYKPSATASGPAGEPHSARGGVPAQDTSDPATICNRQLLLRYTQGTGTGPKWPVLRSFPEAGIPECG